jgi:hypothetical protein
MGGSGGGPREDIGAEGRSFEDEAVVGGEREFLRLTATRFEGGDNGDGFFGARSDWTGHCPSTGRAWEEEEKFLRGATDSRLLFSLSEERPQLRRCW